MPSVKTRTARDGTVRYYVRFRANGLNTSWTFDTDPEAQQFARDVEQRGGDWALDNLLAEQEFAGSMTLSEWAARHFDALPSASPATLTNYRRDWRIRWEPHLGHMKIDRITSEDVRRALAAQTGADKTIANAWGVLTGMFKAAELDNHIERSPAVGVKLGRSTDHEAAEHRYLNAAELLQVIEDTTPFYRPLMWMLVGTGMRWSEATALTAGDVDLNRATVRVTKAWKSDRENKRFYVGPTKTKKSRRTVTLPPEVVEAVRPLVTGKRPDELLFVNKIGEWVKHQTFYRDQWRTRSTRSIPDPKPRIHDLRHSHVALLIGQGISLPVIQARLGHEKITTTIDTYGHLLPDVQAAAADAASRVLSGARPPKEI
ncbi:MAG: tyrosine-type recombinase/integrase [Nocardioides sp.]|uniref:tyrosine-type recombinase/integrase n=1 Tax=Nocardioides sp. TaxID=35761 RepID=UPI003F11CD78